MPSHLASQLAAQQELSGLAGWAVDVISALGAIGIGALTLLENLFPPIPSEVVLPLGGYLVGRGEMPFVLALVAATLGAVIGAVLLYGAGRAWGQDRVNRMLGKLPLVEPQDLDKGEDWFERHGQASVLLGRFVPGVRSLVSLPAGFQRMPFWRFFTLTLIGTVGWNAALIAAGYLLGSQWKTIGEYSDYLNYAVYAVIALLLIRFVWKRRDRIGGHRSGRTAHA